MPTAGSFGGADFGVRIGNVERRTESDMTAMHIPGGDVNVIDLGGRLTEPLSYELFFANHDEYDAMQALVGDSQTLVAYDFSGTAYLKSLTRTWVNPREPYATIARAEFIA